MKTLSLTVSHFRPGCRKKEKGPLHFFSLSASRAATEEKEKKLVCACVWYRGKERNKKEKSYLSFSRFFVQNILSL
jgi:hypothetical protein